MEYGSNFDGELLLASTAFEPFLVGKPDQIIDLTATDAELLTVRPTHLRYFINANLLIAEILNRVYESGWICHELTIPGYGWFVKYIITKSFGLLCDGCGVIHRFGA
jgi:hypothetical protein